MTKAVYDQREVLIDSNEKRLDDLRHCSGARTRLPCGPAPGAMGAMQAQLESERRTPGLG